MRYASALALAVAGLCLAMPTPSAAEDLTPSQIIDALRTDLPGRGERGLSIFGGGEPEPPSVNLRVQFEYNEATLTDEAVLTLGALGEALSSDILGGLSFEIIGHTDATGSVDYNQDLSERRAQSVVGFLTGDFGVDPARLRWSGEGESRLLDIDNPESGENRRVEIRTIMQEE
jgi:outer membrane protein OmpA-like peptidoglycan-associated protein